MRTNRMGIGLLAALAALTLSACQPGGGAESSATAPTTATAPPLLDVDVSTLLTPEQVGAAVGVEVGEAQVMDEGTIVHFASADAQTTAEVSLKKCERATYDETRAMYEDAADAPNLGEAAMWSPSFQQLLVYGKGYMISVVTDIAGKDAEASLVAARQLAVLTLDKLPG